MYLSKFQRICAAHRAWRLAGLLWLLAAVAGCARYGATQAFLAPAFLSGPSGALAIAPGVNVQVQVQGLLGRDLRLQVSGSPELRIDRDGLYALGASSAVASVGISQQPQLPQQSCALSSQNSAGTLLLVRCADAIAPVLVSAAPLAADRIRLYFSRAMLADSALLDPTAYRLSESNLSCTDNASYSTAAASADASVVSITPDAADGSVVELELSAGLNSGRRYYLAADRTRLRDQSPAGNLLGCPNAVALELDAAPQLVAAECVLSDSTASEVVLRFSAAMLFADPGPHPAGSVSCADTTECARRFQITGPADAGAIRSVTPLNGTNCGGRPADASGLQFCLEHTLTQNSGLYTLLAANARDGDGFDNLGCGDGVCAVRNSANTSGPDFAPGDRVNFLGCGAADGTPLSIDPYGDGTSFSQLVIFAGRIFAGPGGRGDSLLHFRPDGSDPSLASFRFARDTTGVLVHANAGNHQSIGFSGCVAGDPDPARNCGPHGENARGLLASARLAGEDLLWLSGARPTAGNNDYLYFAREVASELQWNYMDLSATFNGTTPGPNEANRGVESIASLNDRLYVVMPGDHVNRPYVLRLNTSSQEAIDGVDAEWLYVNLAPGIGQNSLNPAAHPQPAYGDRLGATLGVFRDRLYLASTGSVNQAGSYTSCLPGQAYPACENDGGIIRSENNNPAPCTGPGVCADWADTTPSSVAYRRNFSLVMEQTFDLNPYQRPYPGFVEFEQQLYLARNACAQNQIDFTCRESLCNDDVACTNPVPQLWKCTPELSGDPDECDNADWGIVAGSGANSDQTNLGDANNRQISLLIAHAGALYLGFDNPVSGVELWRTRGGITDPATAVDFEQVGADGLGDPAARTRFFSSASVSEAALRYLYIAAGNTGAAVQLFVQQD